MAFAFEKLLVYQKAIDFSDNVCQLTQTFPRGFYFLVDQLNRAAVSIAANIAEGIGRFTIRDRKIFSVSLADRFRNASRCWNWQSEDSSFHPQTKRK